MVPISNCARSEIVPTLTFVAASYAEALQVSHFIRVVKRKLLRIDAKRAEKFRQLVSGVGPLFTKNFSS